MLLIHPFIDITTAIGCYARYQQLVVRRCAQGHLWGHPGQDQTSNHPTAGRTALSSWADVAPVICWWWAGASTVITGTRWFVFPVVEMVPNCAKCFQHNFPNGKSYKKENIKKCTGFVWRLVQTSSQCRLWLLIKCYFIILKTAGSLEKWLQNTLSFLISKERIQNKIGSQPASTPQEKVVRHFQHKYKTGIIFLFLPASAVSFYRERRAQCYMTTW